MRNAHQDRRTKNRRSTALVLLCCLTLTVYFAHHAMYGRFGIESNSRLSARASKLAGSLSSLQRERAAFDRDIALLSGAPHPDIIEEAAQRVLGYTYPSTRIVPITD